MAKILECIIQNPTVTLLGPSFYLDENLHGFMDSRGTITALAEIKKLIKETLLDEKYCDLVNFDIGGAFDVIDWFILASIIQDLPIPDYLTLSGARYFYSQNTEKSE